jgi:uncharacterized phage-associated protein
MTATEEKILNGIKYFIKNTKNVGRTKLFKLLFFWDFYTFKKYGKSITGYDYYSYPFGPVPKELYNEIIEDRLPDFLDKNLAIIEKENDIEFNSFKTFKVILKNKKIDLSVFSKNELNTLEEIAFTFQNATASEMSEITHLPHSPWSTTVEKNGYDTIIDYILAIDESSPFTLEEAKERLQLQKELIADGRLL